MKEIKPSSTSSTYVSKKFSPSRSYSPDAKKPFLSGPSCLFLGSVSLSLDLAIVLWTSRRKQKGFGGGKTPPQQQADQNSEKRKKRHKQSVCPEESHRDNWRNGSHLLGERLRELFSLEKRSLWDDLIAAFHCPKGAYKKDGERLSTRGR